MKTPTQRRRIRRRAQSMIDIIVTIAILVAVGVVVWNHWPRRPPPIPLPAEPIAINGATTKGESAARVVVIELSDFECPYCAAFARDTLPAIERQYLATGKVRLAYLHITPPAHRRALPAAIAAQCAGRQGKFWEMHDRLFADQKLDEVSLAAHAGALGLDLTAFKACQADPAIVKRIARDTAEARRLRVTATPSFFVGLVLPDGRVKVTRSLRGAVPLAEMEDALDAELGEGLLGTLFSLAHPAGLVGAGAGAGLIGLALWVRRRRARTVGDVTSW
jgi:protein-disulfide isomerase